MMNRQGITQAVATAQRFVKLAGKDRIREDRNGRRRRERSCITRRIAASQSGLDEAIGGAQEV
jgi:hypothetical protein